MIDPNYQDAMEKFVSAAKFIIYDKSRADSLLKMMATESGAIIAVHTVVAAIEQHKPVPKEIAPLLGVAIFSMLVALLKKVFGKTPPPNALKAITVKIMTGVASAGEQAQSNPQAPAPAAAPAAAGGIIQGAMA